MLGKLAVRLRMLGYDTTYYHNSKDGFLLQRSKEEDRILLTRDLQLTKIKDANAYFVSNKILKEQLREVIKKFDLKIDKAQMFTRCSLCNEPLEAKAKAEAKGKIPPLAYRSFDEFSYCPKCDKYYWKGTHCEKIMEDLKDFIS